MLEATLEDHRFLAHTQPLNPDHDRVAGDALVVLQRRDEAQDAYRRAIDKDYLRLETASDATSEARVRWSLGRTLVAMGEPDAASAELARARALPSDAMTRYRLDEWMRDNLDTAIYAALLETH